MYIQQQIELGQAKQFSSLTSALLLSGKLLPLQHGL